jgi:hypothetical protein
MMNVEDDYFVTRKVYSQKSFNSSFYKREEAEKFNLKAKFESISFRLKNADKKYWFKKQLYNRLPFLNWLIKYNVRKSFISDLLSGITVGFIQIIQGMAYGMLAGLPSTNGIYTSLFPGLIYWIFATSQHISIGAYAVVAMLVSNTVTKVIFLCL